MSECNLQSWKQPMHQSSIKTCLRCKRKYLFRNRYCIRPKQAKYSPATNHGRLVHRLHDLGPDGVGTVRQEVKDRQIGLWNQIEEGEDLLGYLAREANDLDNQFNKALVICNLLWAKYPETDRFKVLAKETEMGAILRLGEDNMFAHLVGTIDKLVLDTKTDLIWIRDTKTSGDDAAMTLTGYQFGLQLQIYKILANIWLAEQKEFPELDNNRTVDGFIVDFLQTPGIILSAKDRDFTEHDHVLKSGPRKGQVEKRRIYEGDPLFENYLERCKQWYKENGDEAAKSFAVRFAGPMISQELLNDLRVATVYSMVEADPANFGRDLTGDTCKQWRRVCPYYDLCSSPVGSWEAIVADKYEVREPEITIADPSKPHPDDEVEREGPKIIVPGDE